MRLLPAATQPPAWETGLDCSRFQRPAVRGLEPGGSSGEPNRGEKGPKGRRRTAFDRPVSGCTSRTRQVGFRPFPEGVPGAYRLFANLPDGVGVGDAVYLGGIQEMWRTVDLSWDPTNTYTLWSGLFGGFFLFLASFGTDHIINPYDTFAERFAMMFQSPSMYMLYEWMTSLRENPLTDFSSPPRGEWILCGFGRFGKAICARLKGEGIDVVVVEAQPERTGTPEGEFVEGRGTEAETLLQARIEEAAGLVAGTDDDANNLSIVMTAREINEKLFVVVRQNQHDNRDIIRAVDADMVMHPSAIIADKIRERQPDSVMARNRGGSEPTEDDPYQAYPVPDDLMW